MNLWGRPTRRERLAADLRADGLEVLDDLGEIIGVDPFSMRVALEYAGIPWRFEGTGSWVEGNGDESDAPEVWVEPWTVPLVYGLAVHPMAPLEPAGNLSNRTVAQTVQSTRHFGAMLYHAQRVLTGEDRAALLAIYALVIGEDHRVLAEFLDTRKAVEWTTTLPADEFWREAHDRVKAVGDWRDDGSEEVMF